MDACDFAFDYGTDVIEEDALNRKFCIEVLKRLTSKADTDIEELEGELLVLDTQLEWAKDDNYTDFFDICSKALEKEIKSLKLSICSLKNKDNPSEENYYQSEMKKEPLKKIHEIITALLNNSFQDKHEQDGQQTEVVVEGISDAPIHSFSQCNHNPSLHIIGSSAKTDEDEINEPVVTPKDVGHSTASSSEPEMISNQPEKGKFQEAGVACTTSNDNLSLNLCLMLQEQKDNNMTESEQVKAQKPRSLITAKVIDLTSSLKMKRQGGGGNKIQQDKSEIQKAGVAKTIRSDCPKPSSRLQDQKSAQVDVLEPRSSATAKDVTSEYSPTLQKKRKKELVQSDKIKVKESGRAGTTSNDSVKSTMQRKNITQSAQVVVPESRIASEVLNSKVSLKFARKRAKDIVQSKINRGREPPISDNRMSITLFSALDSEQKVAESETDTIHSNPIVSYKLGVLRTAEDGKKSSKEKRKRPNQVDAPSKAPGYIHFSVDEMFKSASQLGAVELKESTILHNEPQNSLCSGTEPYMFSKVGDSHTILHNEPQKSMCSGPEPFKLSKIGDFHNEMSEALIDPDELHQLKLVELKFLAKKRGLKGHSKFTKEKLVQLLTEVSGD